MTSKLLDDLFEEIPVEMDESLLKALNILRPKYKFKYLHDPSRLIQLVERLDIAKKLSIEINNNKKEPLWVEDYYQLITPIPQLESLSNPEIVGDLNTLDVFKIAGNINLVYDLSTEAITFSDYTSKQLIKFHNHLKQFGLNPKRIFLICANRNAEEGYKLWADKNNLGSYRINMLGYHFYLLEYYWENSKCEWVKAQSQKIFESSSKTVKENIKRRYHFICLNLRPRWHRTAIVLHLLERGFLDKGIVSYHGDDFSDHDSVDTAAVRKNQFAQLKSKDRLIRMIDTLDKMTPMVFDRNASEMRRDVWTRQFGQIDHLIPEGEQTDGSGISSYFEIVTETWLSDQMNSYITEKTIRPILRFQPFIHIGSPHLLAELRDMGFQTFSPFIDESYDEVDDPYERMELIFKEVDRLCSMSIDEIHNIYCSLWKRLVHNYNHFTKNTTELACKEIKDRILSKIYHEREAHE